jgi:hypothetical protein
VLGADGEIMGRLSAPPETLYYGSNRQQQYWENEAQTLRIVREGASSLWFAYRKQDGAYRPVPARPPARSRSRKLRRRKGAEPPPIAGRSAEEVVARLRRDHHLHLVLEQRLRRWMNKASGERVLAFLDPNQGGAPVLEDPSVMTAHAEEKE